MTHGVWLLVSWLLAGPAGTSIALREGGERAGLTFDHENGATEEKFLIETMGGGCALLDYDGDGFLDILFVDSGFVPGQPIKGPVRHVLYRNQRDGTFADVTARSGLKPTGYGNGAATGDYDNDGDTDIYILNYGANTLFRNNGDGSFSDVTAKAGVGDTGWGVSAAFFDYDRDGRLDLYVVNYLEFQVEHNIYCGEQKPGYRAYCHPDHYPGQSDRLYRNRGDGTFEDVSRKSGIYNTEGKGLGVVTADLNNDGWQDVYVANDSVGNFLFVNKGDGTFDEIALYAGAGYDENGNPLAGMGTDLGDYNQDGWLDIAVANLPFQGYSLYRNNGDDTFTDVSQDAGVRAPSMLFSGFGMVMVDLDNDGDVDLFFNGGHVMDNAELYRDQVTTAQPKLVLENRQGRFVDVTREAGPSLLKHRVSRGLAVGDLDNDGDLDLVVSNIGGTPELLWNDGARGRNWLLIEPTGTASTRDCVGLRATYRRGDKVIIAELRGGGSYASANDPRLHLGLGDLAVIEELEIRWPTGKKQLLKNVKSNQILKLKEP